MQSNFLVFSNQKFESMADVNNLIKEPTILIITFIIGATVLGFFYISNLLQEPKEDTNSKCSEKNSKEKEKHISDSQISQKSSKKKHTEKWKDSKQNFSHAWLVNSFKGHSGQVLDMDFSSNNKYLATCGEDRCVFLWTLKEWSQRDQKPLRVNIQYDHARLVRWSPDCKAFMIHRANDNFIEVYKVGRKPEGVLGPVNKAISFKKEHSEDVVGMDIACSGRFIITCSGKTDLLVWDLKGNILTRVDTYVMETYSARISPCGRFIVASGFTSDIKVWEVLFTKTGEFNQVSRVFELSGHTSGVYDFGISSDSSSMASVSKDGTWKVYNTKVEYKNGEDPHLVTTGKYKSNHHVSRIALSPNGQVVVISTGPNLAFYDATSGQLDKEIENIFPGKISCIKFDASGQYLLCAGYKHVHVFCNGTGYRVTIRVLQEGLATSKLSSTQRERMQKQIEEAENALREINEEP